ncbi:MAG: hypothetical protein ACSLFN_05165 [Candidatus Limnocylindrales bacterium]
MAKQRYQLPKEGLTDPEGQGRSIVDGDDVEGHGIPLTPPPSLIGGSRPGHGGENIPSPVEDEDDV